MLTTDDRNSQVVDLTTLSSSSALFKIFLLTFRLSLLLFLLILKIRNYLSFVISTINLFVVLFNYIKLVTELDIETTIPDS